MPQLKKAELIEGVVYVPSPVNCARHGRPHFRLSGWLSHYVLETTGVHGADNATVRLDLDNEPQPDLLLYVLPECGGQATTEPAGYVEGAPELVAEVAASRVSYDLHDKLHAYRRNGVQEYLVWRVDERAVDWFALRGGQYEQLPVHAGGIVRSEVFPGLWLGVEALLHDDDRGVRAVLEQGIGSSEHGAFVRRLQTARR